MPGIVGIRSFRPEDVIALCAIELRAGRLLAAAGFPQIADEPERSVAEFLEFFARAKILVATDAADVPVGFAASEEITSHLWLSEISVDPIHGRRGIGAALLEAVIADAEERGLPGVALSTFRDVPFNAPFYRKHGFAEVDVGAVPALLAARFEAEIPAGIDRQSRALMIRRL